MALRHFLSRIRLRLSSEYFQPKKVGIEAQKERKAGAAQTLTALRSYWKGRKPLVLVRACVLASLLPATDDLVKDLEVFEALMGMDYQALTRRQPKVTAGMVWNCPGIQRETKERHLLAGAGAAQDDEAEDDTAASAPAAKSRKVDLAILSFRQAQGRERSYRGRTR